MLAKFVDESRLLLHRRDLLEELWLFHIAQVIKTKLGLNHLAKAFDLFANISVESFKLLTSLLDFLLQVVDLVVSGFLLELVTRLHLGDEEQLVGVKLSSEAPEEAKD